jgi:hypothetical protein
VNYLWNQLERASCDTVGAQGFAYALRDVDGDLRPDIVVYTDCTDATVGISHWDVYLNNAPGFADVPVEFALPEPPPNHPWSALERTTCDVGGQGAAYSLVDVNGDLRLDLLIFSDCADATVGTAEWRVYLNDGRGFASEPIVWPLPEPQANYPWNGIERTSCDTVAARGTAYSLRDMTGDGLPDLFIYNDCSSSLVGLARWEVYPNVCDAP